MNGNGTNLKLPHSASLYPDPAANTGTNASPALGPFPSSSLPASRGLSMPIPGQGEATGVMAVGEGANEGSAGLGACWG